jgi:hypothetical protein
MNRTFSSATEVVLQWIVVVMKALIGGLLPLVAFGMLQPMALVLSDP